jgi:predicted RNase H-like HicB family nuclease/DNA-binding XRE family transcriptional regulator
MIYYVKLTKQSEESYLASFSDLEGCFTEGCDKSNALKNAKEALDGWLASNCDRDLAIPEPKVRRGSHYHPIEVDVKVSFPIMLRRARKKRNLSQKQAAEKLFISQQAYAKLETPLKSNPALSTVQKLSEALELDFDLILAA